MELTEIEAKNKLDYCNSRAVHMVVLRLRFVYCN